MRWRIMAAAAFCVAGWASGDVPSDPSREFLLPSGTLKAFAEYIPAYGKGAVPGPEETEPVRLEQAIDATRAAKDARGLGDVYKRQPIGSPGWMLFMLP